eukprot:m.183643 g.183643  ORF g.183643 m.183643 type:complete len:588 (+) comp14696_c0_seq2:132-1895(+)
MALLIGTMDGVSDAMNVTYVVYACVGAWLALKVGRAIMCKLTAISMRPAAKKQREEELELQRKTLAQLRSELSEETISRVSALEPAELKQQLQDGSLTALVAAKVCLYNSLRVSVEEGDNSVCFIVPGCLERAAQLDRERAEGAPVPPLFGVPFSVKECFHVKGLPSCIGMTSDCTMKRPLTSIAVKSLEDQGAVPIVTTNIPQTMLTYECSNPVYGETSNPHMPGRSPGGSSGGEGSLHARKAVPFGIGSDIGGSARVPAHFCGVCGFKPTSHRISKRNTSAGVPGQTAIPSVVGPMSYYAKGCSMMFEAWCSDYAFKQDAYLVPIQFQKEMYESKDKLKIAYFCDEGNFYPMTPACARAVPVAVKALEKLGHELVPIPTPDLMPFVELFYSHISADSGNTVLNVLKCQDIDPRIQPLVNIVNLPKIVHTIAKWLPKSNSTSIVANTGGLTVEEVWKKQSELFAANYGFYDMMESEGFDLVLTPASGMPAAKQGHVSALTPLFWPTFLFNALDMPAGIVPVTRVTAEDDAKLLSEYPQRDMIEKKVIDACRDSAGLPVAVQIVGKRWQGEKVLRVMEELEASVGYE